MKQHTPLWNFSKAWKTTRLFFPMLGTLALLLFPSVEASAADRPLVAGEHGPTNFFINISPDNVVSIAGQAVTLEQLPPVLAAAGVTQRTRLVVLASGEARNRAITSLVDVLKSAGYPKITLTIQAQPAVEISASAAAGAPGKPGSAPAAAAELRRGNSSAPEARMSWWREAKFGMFIHWGLYSALAGSYNGKEIDNNGEWIMDRALIPVAAYAAYAKGFNPVKFDAAEWVRIAKRAGMKYIVITAKHHDGFAMYPSQVSAFNLHDATPFKRDPLAELAEACRKEGLRFGLYYSQALDWHHPGGQPPNRGWWDVAQHGDMTNYINAIAVPQVREICTRYGPLAEIWWDMPRNMTPEFAAKLHAVVRELQPQALMNNRLGGGVQGDMETPEQFIPSTGGPEGRDWETCMTMNNTWGFKQQDTDWKSTEDLLRKLLDICHKGGNFLLNVGPTAEGVIPPCSVERLEAIGHWLEKNGEAVYGTTASPLPFLSWGRCTLRQGSGQARKESTLYLHVFDWPASGELRVPMQAKIIGAHLLASPDTPLSCAVMDGAIVLHLPKDMPDALATVIKLNIEGEPVVAPPLTRKKPARASFGEAAKAFDGSAGRAWEAKKGDKSGWLEVDLGQPTPVAAMAFDEPHRGAGKRGQKFRLLMKAGADWKDIITGVTKGYGTTQLFPAVIGQIFRLEIFESKDTAAVAEWQLYRPE
jgi:alpha-L-fucosidase